MKRNVFSYVGYAIKARKIVLGVDNIVRSRKCHIVLLDGTLSENSRSKLLGYLERSDSKWYVVNVEELYPRKNCKAIGITEQNLASAIIKEMEGDNNE